MQAAAVCLPQLPAGAEATLAAGGGSASPARAEGLVPFASMLQAPAPSGGGVEGDDLAAGGREEIEKLAIEKLAEEGVCAEVYALLAQLLGGAAAQRVEPGTAAQEAEAPPGADAIPPAGAAAATGAGGAAACGTEALQTAQTGPQGAFAPPGALPGGISPDASGSGGADEASTAFRPGARGASVAEKAVAGVEQALRGALDEAARPERPAASAGDAPPAGDPSYLAAETAVPAAEDVAQAAQEVPSASSARAGEDREHSRGAEAGVAEDPAAQENAKPQSGKTPAAAAESTEPPGAEEKAAGEGRGKTGIRRENGSGGDERAESAVFAARQDAPRETGGLPRVEKASAAQRALLKFADDLRGIGGGEREIHIVLEPESLGALEISVVKTEKGVAAKIRSADREICAAISESLKGLAASLEARGVAVRDLNVEYLSPDLGGGFQQGAGSGAGGGFGGGRPAHRRQDAERDDLAAFFGFDVPPPGDGASVEYRV